MALVEKMRRKTDVFFIPAETFLAKFSPLGELNLACGAAARAAGGRTALVPMARHGRPGGSAVDSSSESRRRGGFVFLIEKSQVEGVKVLLYDQPLLPPLRGIELACRGCVHELSS